MSEIDVPAASHPRRLAAALLGVQVLAILGFSVFYVVELAGGHAGDRGSAAMSVVVFLIGAAGLSAGAVGLWRGARWPRTPSVLWNVLLLPVAVALVQSEQHAAGLTLAAVAVAGIGAVLCGGRSQMPRHP